jgi:biopolymer transport protein ExbD
MGLKKRSKINAAFNMSSLTDIIFLLLIFFMLTSSLVAPNSLNLKLPGTSRSNIATTSDTDDVSISLSGRYFLNGKRISLTDLEQELRRKSRGSREKMNMIISPESGTPTEYVVAVMDIALRLEINGILAPEKN